MPARGPIRIGISSCLPGQNVRVHTAHKMALLAHSPEMYAELGRLVAGAKSVDRASLESRYRELFMDVLAKMATTRKHTNVPRHMAGHFKDLLDADEKQELLGSVEDYRLGLVPLIVPVTLVKHYVRRHKVEYLAGQVYLDPHPKELMLRNHL